MTCCPWSVKWKCASTGGYVLAVIPNPVLGLVYGIMRWVVAIVLLRYFWKEKQDCL